MPAICIQVKISVPFRQLLLTTSLSHLPILKILLLLKEINTSNANVKYTGHTGSLLVARVQLTRRGLNGYSL